MATWTNEPVCVLIAGAGGHGQVVADILLAEDAAGRGLRPIGFVDDNASLTGKIVLGLPILGTIADCATIAHDAVILAIGDNAMRARQFLQLQQNGEQFTTTRHPSAILARQVAIGMGTVVCAGAIVNPGATIGCNAILNSGCIVEHHCVIGDHVHIAPGVRMGGEVVVGQGTLVGIGSIVLPGARIGAGCVIGGGAVVTADVADNSVMIGVPARFIRNTPPMWQM